MRRYIFLDNWVLADFTKSDRQPYLSSYIKNKQLTVILDSLSLTELYNPGWENTQENDRISRATNFLSKHPTIIVDPVKVFRAEIENYPKLIQDLPLELDLEVMSAEHREQSLKLLLHHDELFINQGKDIRTWVENYKKEKSELLSNIDKIIKDAVRSDVLTTDKAGRFIQLESEKEKFLLTLDRRHFGHFSDKERVQLGTKIVELFEGETSKLHAVRFTSLCFWYAYVQADKTHLFPKTPSDIGDFCQMSMIPYCAVFTADNKMQWLSKRIANATSQISCLLLNKNDLDKEIGFIS